MKKIISFTSSVLVILFAWLICPFISAQTSWLSFNTSNSKTTSVQLLSFDTESAVVEITLAGLEVEQKVENEVKFQKISLPNYFRTTNEIGKPEIPSVSFSLGVPDLEAVSFTIIDSSIIKFSDFNIYPVQEPFYGTESRPFVIDESFYKTDSFYPTFINENSNPSELRNIRTMDFSIYPIRFNPNAKELYVYNKIKLKIEFNGVKSSNIIVKNSSVSSEWDKMYASSILNYNYIQPSLSIDPDISITEGLKTDGDDEYDYLIITVDKFYDHIKRFADWKLRKGFRTNVKKLSEIGGNNWNNIENYIDGEYANNIKYTLLVGDVDELQMMWIDDTDIRYGDVINESTWPFTIEVPIGRITPKRIPRYQQDPIWDINYFIDKEINYEIQAPSSNFVKKVLLVSSDDKYASGQPIYDPTSEYIRTYSYVNQPTFVKAYGTEGATNTDVNNHINNGLGIVNYRGHGGPVGWDGWSGSSTYATTHAYLLNNQLWNPVVFSIACQTAHMYNNDETLAEAFVKTTYGASAFLGACEDVDNDMDNHFDKLLFKTIYDNNIYHIGNDLISVINNHNEVENSDKYYYLWLGEPSLELWTDSPQQFTNLTVTDNGSSLTINTGVSGSEICVSSTNSGSTYYSVIHNTSSYTFNTAVRPLYITVTKHNYIPYTAITGGTISTDEYWMGNLKILGSLVLSNGKTLKIGNGSPQVQGSFTIQQGAQLFFRKGSSLIVNGSLTAQGISTNKITFDLFDDPDDPSDKWNGIVFNSGSNGTVEYCNIKSAVTGITCNSTLPNIRYNTISNNLTGISVSNIGTPSTEISFNTIQNDSSKGINLYYASPKIYSNTIANNASCGIYCYYSNPYLYGNTIYGHSSGLTCISYSSSYLVPWNAYGYYWGRGYNVIRDNSAYEINAAYWSNLYLGSSPYGGYNSIYDGTSSLEMYAAYNCNIMAEINWWGNNPNYSIYQSTFDNDPWLSSPPGSLQKSNSGNDNLTIMITANSELDKAYELQLDGKFDEAILIYDKFIKENPGDTWAAYALVRIHECYRLSGKKDFINYLDNEVRNKALVNSDLDAVSIELKNRCLVEDQNYHEAVINFNLLAEKYKENPFVEKYSLFNTGFIYFKYLNDYKSAEEMFSKLSVKYPNDALVEEIKYLLGEDGSTSDQGSPRPKLSSARSNQSLRFELMQNYPNPFNPTTKINFSVAEEGKYTLKIINILGQEVETLFDEYINPGNYDIDFNASSIPSGVYIYQLSSNKIVISKKLMLIR